MTAQREGEVPLKHPHAAYRVYDEEAFVVLPQAGSYKLLNKVGTRVWELIDGSRTLADIAVIVADEDDVTYESALADVRSFVSDLEANGMLAGSGTGKVA